MNRKITHRSSISLSDPVQTRLCSDRRNFFFYKAYKRPIAILSSVTYNNNKKKQKKKKKKKEKRSYLRAVRAAGTISRLHRLCIVTHTQLSQHVRAVLVTATDST